MHRLRAGRALVLAATLGLLGACAARLPPPRAPLDGFPLDRLDRVDAGVYRSAQPTAEQFRALQARYGIKTVLKLNRGADEVPPGMTVLHRPLDALVEPSAAELAAILDDIERAEKPVLIHCTHGEDRTGLLVALYRMRRGVSVEEARADMLAHRFHDNYPGVYRAWRRAAAAGAVVPARAPGAVAAPGAP